MANIGKLNVTLIANSGPFQKGLVRASNMADRFAKRMKTFGGGVSRVMGAMYKRAALVGAVFGGAMVLGINRAAGAIDDLAKSSRKLLGNQGATGTLAGLRMAGELAGVSVAELDKGMEKMLETIGKAGEGDKMAIEALDRVGVTAEQLKRARPEERLQLIANGIAKIGDVGDRVTAARGIFGRGGTSLTLLFQGGAKAIADATREAQRFGLALSAKASGGVEKMNDNFTKLKAVLDGTFMQITAKIAPVINEATDALLRQIDTVGGVGEAVETAFGYMVREGATVLNVIESIELGWLKAKKAVLDFSAVRDRGLAFLTGSEERGKRTAEERILSGIPEDKRDEARGLLRAAGGAENESLSFGRRADGYAAESADVGARIAELEKNEREDNQLGDRFQRFIFKAQNNAENFAGDDADDRLATEEQITDEVQKQADIRRNSEGRAGSGNAKMTAFRGPTYRNEGSGIQRQTTLLERIADNTRQTSAVMA